MLTFQAGAGITYRAPSLSDVSFTILASPQTDVVVSPGEELTILDYVYSSGEGTYDNVYSVVVDGLPLDSPVSPVLSVVAGDEVVAVLGAGGRLSRVSDGVVRVNARSPWLTRQISLAISRTSAAEVPLRYVQGSLGAALTDGVLAAAAGAGTAPLLSVMDHGAANYLWNANNWVSANFTGRPVWSQQGGSMYNGALISPRHLITAAHAQVYGSIRFLTADNQVVTRSIVSAVNVFSDMNVSVLDSDVPSGITHYRVLPANYSSYLATYHVPLVQTRAAQQAVVREWTSSMQLNPSGRGTTTTTYATGPLAARSTDIMGGDSGSASFMLLNGELLLTGTHHTGYSTGSGHVFVSSLVSEVNAAMTALGGGYQLQTVDLSSYPTY